MSSTFIVQLKYFSACKNHLSWVGMKCITFFPLKSVNVLSHVIALHLMARFLGTNEGC